MRDTHIALTILRKCRAFGLDPYSFPKFKQVKSDLIRRAIKILRTEEILATYDYLPYEVKETVELIRRLKKAKIEPKDSFVYKQLPRKVRRRAEEFLKWAEA